MRKSIAILLTFLISATIFCEVPSDSEIDLLYESRPELVREMVKKLYVLERADPTISFPNLTLIETEDGLIRVSYESPMEIVIGSGSRNLLYSIELSPTKVEYAEREEPDPFPWRVVGVSVLVGTIIGVLGGVFVAQ